MIRCYIPQKTINAIIHKKFPDARQIPDVPSLVMDINTLRPRQNGRHFPDDIFKCIFLNENVLILIKISLKFVPKGPIDIIPALVQIIWTKDGYFTDAYMRHSASMS